MQRFDEERARPRGFARTLGIGLLTAWSFVAGCVEGNVASIESTSDGGAPNALSASFPIHARAGRWSWVDVPGTTCGDGSQTGLAINPSPSAHPTGLMIYMEPGGACWDYGTCSAHVAGLGVAFHLNGYDATQWNTAFGATFKNMPLFDRSAATNPFRDAHWVFLPYCTADVLDGDADRVLTSDDGKHSMTLHFRGHRNMLTYLARLKATFPFVQHIWVTGSSAGAFGAGLNWGVVADAFPHARVDALADSGQPINPTPERWQTWLDTWNLYLPPGCSDCDQGVTQNVLYAANTLLARGSRYGLLVWERDAVISAFFGLTQDEHQAEVDALRDLFNSTSIPNHQNARYFARSGAGHTMLIAGYDTAEVNGVALSDWLTQMVTDDPAWSNAGP